MKKIIINENQEIKLINEYADKLYNMSLFNYLNKNDEDKKNELIGKYSSYFISFLSSVDWVDYGFDNEKEFEKNVLNKLHDIDDDDDEKLDELSYEICYGDFKTFKDDFYDYILRNYYMRNVSTNPSWMYLKNPTIIKNQWLIHFSNNSYDISKEGFKYGANDKERVAYTRKNGAINSNGTFNKSLGYNFAYLLEDFPHFYNILNKYTNKRQDKPIYGDEAVIFRASGILCDQIVELERQVIFWGESAKDFIYIHNENGSEWCISSTKTNKIMYKNKSIEKVVDWIVNNYDQYRKHLHNLSSKELNKNFETNYG